MTANSQAPYQLLFNKDFRPCFCGQISMLVAWIAVEVACMSKVNRSMTKDRQKEKIKKSDFSGGIVCRRSTCMGVRNLINHG